MRTNTILFIIIILLGLNSGCLNKSTKNSESDKGSVPETNAVPDTGYTGIKQYNSGNYIVKEVTFKNGIRQGLMKTFYANGILRQTFWYENGVRQDTGRWFFEDGKTVYRTTPFKDDSSHGIQTQFYKNGKVKAKLNFNNGLRTPYLEEFTSDGKKITTYPEIVIKTKDDYNQNGTFKIYIELTDKKVKSNFYLGEFTDGLFQPKKYKKINASETTGYLELRKSQTKGAGYVGIIAETLTTLGNRNLVYKKIDLPYSDLK